MQELVFVTHNLNKLKEVQAAIPKGIKILSLSEVGYTEEIEETGNTLEENALLKARTVHKTIGVSCFADDTGLEVEVLKGAPGVYSARYAGKECIAENNIDKLLLEMENIKHRNARFRTVFALILNEKEYLFEGVVKGKIAMERHGSSGFGYDPVFIPEGYTQSFAEMSLAQKNTISHRALALGKMVKFLG